MSELLPYMQEGEYEIINKYLSKDDILLEWGSGTGTIYFSKRVKQMFSIEHNESWYNEVKKLLKGNNIENVSLYFVPIISSNCIVEQYKDYIEFPTKNNLQFNKVLVDGRMRKRCTLSLFPFIGKDCLVFIHDFGRDHYHPVLEYFDVVDWWKQGNQTVVLKPKE